MGLCVLACTDGESENEMVDEDENMDINELGKIGGVGKG